MAQSDNIGTILTRNDLINQMYKKASILSEGESLTAEQITDGQNILTAKIYELINKGFKIWKREFATLFLTQGQTKYTLGNDARCTTSYIETKVIGDFTATDVINVESTAGMCVGDSVGIMTATHLNWYTISFLTEGEITLCRELDVDITDGSAVYTYTDTIEKPLHIDQAITRYLQDSTDSIMTLYSREEYFELSNKSSQGIPYNYYADRRLNEIDLYLYTTPQNSQHTIELSYTSPLFITDSPADQMDFPREYTQLLIYSGANELCLENGVDLETQQIIMKERDRLEVEAFNYDREEASIFISPAITDR